MRSTTSAEDTVLQARTRSVHHKVRVKNADGTWITMTELSGTDWLDSIEVGETVDQPVPSGDFKLWKHNLGDGTLAPLDETSALNVDDGGSYAALIDSGREIDWQTAVVEIDTEPSAGDFHTLYHGEIDAVDWGDPFVRIRSRDYLMSHLQDRWIESPTVYGGSQNVETVMQDILDAHTDGRVTLWVPSSPGLSVPDRTMGPMRVLNALTELAQMVGWDLRSRWNPTPGEFQLKFAEPNRNASTTDWDFSTDDYFVVRTAKVDRHNIRNAITVGYTDSSGVRQTTSTTDATSISRFGRRWMGMFLRADDPINTASEANTLRDAALNDLKDPVMEYVVVADFFWPVELGDYYGFTASNDGDERWFSTDQALGLYAYSHEITANRHATTISTRGKPAGQYARWFPWGEEPPVNRRRSQTPGLAVVQGVEIDFDENGEAIVSATGDEYTANLYVTVGDGTTPSDPTSGTNDGSISGRGGSVDTGVAITTGNQAIVKVVAADDGGKLGPVTTAKFSRRTGPFHKNTSSRSVTGTTTETTLETITIPANKLGSNGGVRITAMGTINSPNLTDSKVIRVKLNGTLGLTFSFAASVGASAFGWFLTITLFNDGATNDQRMIGHMGGDNGYSEVEDDDLAEDSTSDMDITITGDLNDTDDSIFLLTSMVEYIGTT